MFNNLEIRMLICKRDLQMGLNMIHSLRKYDIFKTIPIYFHDDGTLDIESKHSLLEVENSHIIDKSYADSTILKLITKYINCKRYRFDNTRILYNTKMKLIDVYLLSKSKNILCIDSDILFLNEPTTIIELINKSIAFYFPDFQNSYSYCKSSKVDVLDKVNTGIFYIPNETYYNIDAIEFALNDLFTIGIANTPHWIEQSVYSHMFYKDGRYIKLDNEKYQIPNPYDNVPTNIESLHFVSHPPIRGLYNDFLKREYL